LPHCDYANAFDLTPIAATLIDQQGYVVDVNQAFLAMAHELGVHITKDDRVGGHVTDFVHSPGERSPYATFVGDLLQKGGTSRLSWRSDDIEGRSRWWDIRAVSLHKANGERAGALILREDITDEVREHRRGQILGRVRSSIWRMRHADDIDGILKEVGDGLRSLEIPFDYCGVNLLRTPHDRELMVHTLDNEGRWRRRSFQGTPTLRQLWRDQQLVYRPDIHLHDPLHERARFPTIRSLVDAPFSHGTVAVSSRSPNAFTDGDLNLLRELSACLTEGFTRLDDLRALRESEQRLRAINELTSDVAYTLRGQTPGELVAEWTSPGLARLTGYTEDETVRMGWDTLVHHEDRDLQQKQVRQVLAGNTASVEYRLVTRNREVRWVRDHARPLEDEHGERATGICGAIQDITHARQAEEALLQSSRLIALGQMAAGMAHELNQPLTGISTIAEGIELRRQRGMELPAERQTHWNQQTLECVDRMRTVIDHLRTFSRDHSALPQERVQLNDVVQGALTLTAAQLRSRGIELQLDLDPDLGTVAGDPHRLEQVLVNLIANARDAMDDRPGCEGVGAADRMALTIRTRTGSEGVVVEVRDTGCGVSERNQTRLFEPFFTTKESDRGTGLGLSISYAIVRDHGGCIDCESVPGRGALFRVSLPVASQHTDGADLLGVADVAG